MTMEQAETVLGYPKGPLVGLEPCYDGHGVNDNKCCISQLVHKPRSDSMGDVSRDIQVCTAKVLSARVLSTLCFDSVNVL